MTLSGGTMNGYDSPTSGRQMVLSWYMRLKDDVAPGSYEVGFNAKQFARLTGTYNTMDAVESDLVGVNKWSIAPEHVTYTNAVVKVGEAGPAVTKTQAEVKMTLNEEKTAVDYAAAPFQFRVISSISEDDWNTYFNGDGSYQSVGAAQSQDSPYYPWYHFSHWPDHYDSWWGIYSLPAKTDYIQKVDGQPANFGARIDFTARENVKDVTYIAFVQYDTDQYAFYDTSFDADLNSNYDDIVSQYAGFIAG